MGKLHDFTQENVLKQLVIFSGPIMVTNLLQTSYQIVDSLWIGNLLGAQALGSVAIASTIIFVVLSFVIGINNAALAILSQQRGRKDEQGLANYLNAFTVILTIMALLLSVFGYFFASTFLQVLGTPEEMMEQAEAYLQIYFIGIWCLFGYNFISTVLRYICDSMLPFLIVFLSYNHIILYDS